MATIRANCYQCGDFLLTQDDIIVVEPDPDTLDSTGEYFFTHSLCNALNVKKAEPRIYDLLRAAGCKVIGVISDDELLDLTLANTDPLDEASITDFVNGLNTHNEEPMSGDPRLDA
jgi:hypothetical protein